MQSCLFNWSGGKDSALALYRLKLQNTYNIVELLTSVSLSEQRISMHGVSRQLLELQAEAINLPLNVVELPSDTTHNTYENIMHQEMSAYARKGVKLAAFGDIFLEDLKKYREDNLKKAGMTGLFPLWGNSSVELIKEFIDIGFKAVVVCVDGKVLNEDFAGRMLDHDFLADLPKNVDPCGENGEFHSFVYDGPLFNRPVQFEKGKVITKYYDSPMESTEKHPFHFQDLINSPIVD